MAGNSILDDIELIIEDIGRGGGGKPPAGGGDGGGDGKRRSPDGSSPRKYAIAIALTMVSILMFFMAMAAAFLVLRTTSGRWVTFQVPRLLWINTAVLIASSLTLELARNRLVAAKESAFMKLWTLSISLGVLFVVGQVFAWRELVLRGIYSGPTLATSFFYVFTAAHAVHLFGGLCALLYVALRNFKESEVTRLAAAELTSYYWHFMDGLWVFLLALLYFGN